MNPAQYPASDAGLYA